MAEETQKDDTALQDMAYGYTEEGKQKSWLDMIVDYLKQSKEGKAQKLEKAI